MKTAEPRVIKLSEYRPPAYRITDIALDVMLDPEATRVTAVSKVKRLAPKAEPLTLNGSGLKLISIKLDGTALDANAYRVDENLLTIHAPPAEFTLEIVTGIAPAKNTALEGLYISNGIYCTQNEPEGFRCITYYLDRPDNLAKFETRIEGPKGTCPVMLSNGNLVEKGDLPGGRHFVRWQDPFPKPSYLYALVAGDLGSIRDTFTTMSGRKVDLSIYVEHGNEPKVTYAMDALKRAMRWDEETYGREYDLDIFMIVAVSAFNFGAMENKGLNIFNDKVLLASPDTATDDDYARIEAVIGHEYFHNWSGNRITCRDWFQISLKEGLTVFRETGFAADMRSRGVVRIADAKDLRLRQFQEDAGPLAHPVQPQSYIAIDNFYTATVYEKGAEVIGMIRTILGADAFRKGMDLYFDRHDGEAATVEDFVKCFEDVSGRDLRQFRLWYRQAGTPVVNVSPRYDATAKVYTLELSQTVPPTPGQPDKKPMHIPLSLALIGRKSGKPLTLSLHGETPGAVHERVIELTEAEHKFVFAHVDEEPVLSIGRHFSAPVIIRQKADRETRAFLMSRDSDAFNRWEAGAALATDILVEMTGAVQAKKPPRVDPEYLDALGGVLARADEDHAFAALMLMPPQESELALAVTPVDPDAIHAARNAFVAAVADTHRARLSDLYYRLASTAAFSPDAKSAGRRALRNAALRFLTAGSGDEAARLAQAHYESAGNMTDMVAGLGNLVRIGGERMTLALADFHDRFRDDPLVLDKWMGLQAMSPQPDTVIRVRELMKHPAFTLKNPNRVRSLIGAFATGNPVRFHDRSGAGYRLVCEIVVQLDSINPQTAARIMTPFETWRRYGPERQALIRAELEAIARRNDLSPNLFEVTTKMLG
jgi:aminopeptidase N